MDQRACVESKILVVQVFPPFVVLARRPFEPQAHPFLVDVKTIEQKLVFV